MKKITYILSVCIGLISLCACKDKDDEKKLSDDPRVRRVVFNELSGYDFIVNDVEGVIYNYDSLPHGTRIDSLSPYIYGYASSDLLVGVKQEGTEVLSLYTGAEKLDFTKPITIVSTSEDTKHNKEYMFDIRVHRYDVDAFDWDVVSLISLDADEIEEEKSLVANGEMLWFVSLRKGEKSECLLFSSNSGEIWERKEIEAEGVDLSSMVWCSDSLFALTKEGRVVSTGREEMTFKQTSLSGDDTAERMLFAMDGRVWYIEGDSLCAYKPNRGGDKSQRYTLPQSLLNAAKGEYLKPFTAMSGYTSLGYCYSIGEDNKSVVWSIDRYGNVIELNRGAVPALRNPLVFAYGETLGILGGEMISNGSLSRKCYCSLNSGLTWREDWHKTLGEVVGGEDVGGEDAGGVSQAGIFVVSDKGEMVMIGGMKQRGEEAKRVSNRVLLGRLKALKLREEFIESIK